jgi:hypothetical protein
MSAVATKEREDLGANNLPRSARICNQTVMSGRIKDTIVDFAAVSLAMNRIRCGSVRSFLV